MPGRASASGLATGLGARCILPVLLLLLRPAAADAQDEVAAKPSPGAPPPPVPRPTTCDAAAEGPTQKVVGGAVETKCRPYYAHIRICGGAVINNKYILTAAHCALNPSLPIGTEARVAMSNRYSEASCCGQTVFSTVTRKFIHPGYDRATLANDIAVLEVDPPLDDAHTVCPSWSPPAPGSAHTVVGFGSLTPGPGDALKFPANLQYAAQEIKPPSACPYSNFDDALSVCCAGPGETFDAFTCAGDSGSPLIDESGPEPAVVGLVSAGTSPCGALPTIYTRLDVNYDFLKPFLKGSRCGKPVEQGGGDGSPPPAVDEPAPTLPSGGKNKKYLGCFVDNPVARDLQGSSVKDPLMTAGMCARYCRTGGYRFFGLQFGIQCFCGSTKPGSYGVAAEGDCDMACGGNPAKMCGGYDRNGAWALLKKGDGGQSPAGQGLVQAQVMLPPGQIKAENRRGYRQRLAARRRAQGKRWAQPPG